MSELYERHKTAASALASIYFPNPADAEDAMQEAYIKLSRVKLTEVENEAGLVYIILSNLFRDLYNKDKRMRELDQRAAVIDDVDDNDPLAVTINESEDYEFSRRFDDLPEDVAQTARLYYIKGLSYKAIADELNIPEGTVASRLSTARAYFRGEEF